jgi:hypothetical protein
MATTTEITERLDEAQRLDRLKAHHAKWPVTVCENPDCPSRIVPGFEGDAPAEPCVFCCKRNPQTGQPMDFRAMRKRMTFDEWLEWREHRGQKRIPRGS